MAENGNSLLPAEKKRLKMTSSSSPSAEDRISKLPDALILHILSFLPTVDIVSTSLLSNRWKLMWYLVPNLSFSITPSEYKTSVDKVKLCNFIGCFLEHRKKAMFYIRESVVTSFNIKITSYDSTMDHRLDKWLAFAAEKKVKEVNLWLGIESSYSLPIPLVNATYLTVLELKSVRLDCRYSFSFPSLKSLSLTNSVFKDKYVLEQLLLGSPSLEKLCINDCGFYGHSRPYVVRSSTLKFLVIKFYRTYSGVMQIEAINLESLELHGVSFDKLDFSVCKAITNLSFTCVWNMNESSSLENLIPNLPLLENLTLGNMRGGNLKDIKILSQNMKSFNVNNRYDGEMTVVIEWAPKLASFSYTGNINFCITMESSNFLNGTFEILKIENNFEDDWFISMIEFLLNLNCSWNMVTLHVDKAEPLIGLINLKIISPLPLVNWEHLRVLTKCKLEKESELRDALRWIFPSLKTISIAKRTS
ncbi:FBD-associated F-box protein At3g52670 [Cannabis sativa]|uniref:FBD-associated F-box protein At3g52670 n=1 Tax=Cannabis sativa TaxID=3483 RepID=UPI0029C9DB0E|nr:FBD-associated F-box protein At3g52670 [Cannabis sativa]